VGACGKPARRVSQEAVGGALSVHGLVSVHATDITGSRTMGDAIYTT
jgi:hypothetical protein